VTDGPAPAGGAVAVDNPLRSTRAEPHHEGVTEYHVAVVDIPDPTIDLGAVETLLRAQVALDNRVWAQVFGHDDFAQVPTQSIHALSHQETRRKRVLVALTGSPFAAVGDLGLPQVQPTDGLTGVEVIGTCYVSNPLLDNQHVIEGLEVVVDPQWRRRGVATALLAAAEQVARRWGATTLMAWGTHRPGSGDDALHPAEGEFSIMPDATSALALSHGYHLAQCERHSTQQIPSEPVTVPDPPPGYALVQWRDHTPEPLLESQCRLLEAMSQDVPKGELDLEDERWTPERLRTVDASRFELHEALVTAVRHVESGRLAGYTELLRARELPAVVWQETTVVLGDHRGLHLGLLLKLANLAFCQQAWPQAQRIHTWNAGENRWMLAINDQLGYQIATVGGAWQKKLDAR